MTRKLIPWRRDRTDVPARVEEENPFFGLHRSMNELFDDFFKDFEGAFRGSPWTALTHRAGTATPRVDVSETDEDVMVTADLPGLEEKDISVTLDNDVLTIRGSRKEEREEKKKNYHLMERSYGEYQRSILVPGSVDKDKVKASFKNGVLKIGVPKLPEAKTAMKKIDIATG
ncbi:MAG: Hsp20/alpha crystallin family protein [bacterium]